MGCFLVAFRFMAISLRLTLQLITPRQKADELATRWHYLVPGRELDKHRGKEWALCNKLPSSKCLVKEDGQTANGRISSCPPVSNDQTSMR